MGGSIFISDSAQIALSTRQFDYVVERVRAQLNPSEMDVIEKVYLPLDEQGMMFISAESLNAQEFSTFSKAVLKAKTAAQDEELFSRFEEVWKEVLEVLQQDPRLGV
ncbi:hypothetical protein J2S30_000069 [Herbaspirillum rubrisubalbicans]|uniref:hypothetical protein n=1 Tax=Herbaspirillum rubrisubalbicans TaxID=80842 RepID=UPI00209EAB90|nr:hypothetical protein [Herbaspirillum rubrisubalbicans]MCP1571690.1 hypothetical protein [Herbaspirillum rubrisubalbicans]